MISPTTTNSCRLISHLHPTNHIHNVSRRARFILRGPDSCRRRHRDHRTFSSSTTALAPRARLCDLCVKLIRGSRNHRPTSLTPSSRPLRSRTSSPSGLPSSPRYDPIDTSNSHTTTRHGTFLTGDFCEQALEGKDVKDLLVNVGSGGGAAAAGGPAAAASGETAAEAEEEAKEEGTSHQKPLIAGSLVCADNRYRTRGVRRGHGIRPLRLSNYAMTTVSLLLCTSTAWLRGFQSIDHTGWRGHDILRPGQSSFVHTII